MPEATPKAPAVKKPAKMLSPIALHLVKAYETSFKLGFLLNKNKSLMGSPQLGFALTLPAIQRLRQIVQQDKHLEFLPRPLTSYLGDSRWAERLEPFMGHSVLEFLAEPIRQSLLQLMNILERINLKDTSEENKDKILLIFNRPLPQDTLPGQPPKEKITPFHLVRQLQQAIGALRQRFQLELATILQWRRGNITAEDCFHALSTGSLIEVKGRLLAAQQILLTMKPMLTLKEQNFQGEFHPKITLERALDNLHLWAPGTPPRMFHQRETPDKGLIPILNDKLLEQLTIFRESTEQALGRVYSLPTTEELIEKAKQELEAYYDGRIPHAETEEIAPPPEGKSAAIAKNITGLQSLSLANPLSFAETLQFYGERPEQSSEGLLQALYFENANARYLAEYVLSVAHAKELRGVFSTLQIDLTQALDLYFIEAQKMLSRLHEYVEKYHLSTNPAELSLIIQPGETSYQMPFIQTVERWTKTYIEIFRKYLTLSEAIEEKILTTPAAIEKVCQMPFEAASTYLQQLRAILQAQEKGYITEEQTQRYLDPERTTEAKLKSIMAFLEAIEKYRFVERAQTIFNSYQERLTQAQSQAGSDARKVKELVKPLEELMGACDPKPVLQELLQGEIYELPPESVDLVIERTLESIEWRYHYDVFRSHYEKNFRDISSTLKDNHDYEHLGKMFYDPEVSPNRHLLGIFNLINGTPEACIRNVFHERDNTTIRDCVLRSFPLGEGSSKLVGTLNNANVQDLLGVDYCTSILISFQYSFIWATRKVFILDAETRNSAERNNNLGVSMERVVEMRLQCESILNKQIPISYALKQLEAIWQTLEKNKIIPKEAKAIADLQQKLEGSVPGSVSLHQRMRNNPANVKALEEYKAKTQEAYALYRKELDKIAMRLRELNKEQNIPSHIREYQRQILTMERSILQTVEELKEASPNAVERLKTHIREKQMRIAKYKKVIETFKKEHPEIELPAVS